MNANPMEEQIGRLVGNLLAGGGEIFLPGVGSLYTERQGARRLNRRTVLPPSRTVAFTSQQRGVSLVDEIARVMREAGGYENPEAEAQAVYDRWIARVHRADLLTVEGVGELKFKNFIPDEAFDLRLNPQGREPVRVRVQRRFDWPLWVGIAAIGIAAVYGGREFLLLYYAQGLNMRQIGERLGVDKSTVSRNIKRGERRLQRCLRYGAEAFLRNLYD